MSDRKYICDELEAAALDYDKAGLDGRLGADLMRRAKAALEASEQCAVVKPLEWLERRNDTLEAGPYQVRYTHGEFWRVRFNGRVVCKSIKGMERAISWANKHNAERILSALTIRPASEVAAEAKAQVIVEENVFRVTFYDEDGDETTYTIIGEREYIECSRAICDAGFTITEIIEYDTTTAKEIRYFHTPATRAALEQKEGE